MSELEACPKCNGVYTYEDREMLVCPECGHEWSPSDNIDTTKALVVKDANGTVLQDGDAVIIVKDLKVKGSSTPLKVGKK